MSLDTTQPVPAQPAPEAAAAHAEHLTPAGLAHLRDQLTTEEKVALLVGAGLWTTTAVPRIGLRAVALSDGPAGVRGVSEHADETSASFPAPSALAATWDVDLADEVGAVFAAEARRHGVDVVLAPQVNLQRTPVGGRHFECYSEDPLLTGRIAVHVVRAAQDRGVGMCVKHFVANDSETQRTSYVARVDERTLREVYLAPFERLVRDARAWSLMGAYSGVDDGTTSAPALEHRPLLTGVLKDEWGFDGVVVSDWVATKTVREAFDGGLDLQMPGPDGAWGDGLLDAVRAGEVTPDALDEKVDRLLLLAHRVGALGAGSRAADDPAGTTGVDVRGVLRRLVARSFVVLKDDEHALPLAPGAVTRVALLGPNAVAPFVQGGGSAYVRPERRGELDAALRDAFGAEVDVRAGAVARLQPPALDLVGRCTTPAGEPGVLVEVLDADGGVLERSVTTTWTGWLRDVRPDAYAVRLRTTAVLDEPGPHEVGVGTVGRHTLVVGGEVLSTSERAVGAEVILDSSVNAPAPVTVHVDVERPRTLELDATVQAVHPVGYASFARAELVHRTPGTSPDVLLADAVAAAAAADLAVVVVGTNEEIESEGYDRTSLALPGTQDDLVRAVVAANPRTVVVVNAGAPVLLPWLDEAPCVVWGWLGGQEWPEAVGDVLTGVTEPAGRLPWTLPADEVDVPVPHAVPDDGVIEYREGVHVGYRSWLRLGRTPAAPFGHGLGWTTWEHDEARVERRAHEADGTCGPDGTLDGVELVVTVRNTGPRAGREVVQVYVEPPAGSADRPVRWLGGFAVVDVDAGRTREVRVPLDATALRTWTDDGWRVPGGTYRLHSARSSTDLRVHADLVLPDTGP